MGFSSLHTPDTVWENVRCKTYEELAAFQRETRWNEREALTTAYDKDRTAHRITS